MRLVLFENLINYNISFVGGSLRTTSRNGEFMKKVKRNGLGKVPQPFDKFYYEYRNCDMMRSPSSYTIKDDMSILRRVKKLVKQKKYDDIKHYLNYCDSVYRFEIVPKSKVFGTEQEEDYCFKTVFINQQCGYCGDDYYGTIFIYLKKGKYLKFEYSC